MVFCARDATLAGLAVASLDWSRQYVGKSALSMELPGELTADTTEVIEDKTTGLPLLRLHPRFREHCSLCHRLQWSRKVKADHKKLADVMVDLIVGIGEDTAKAALERRQVNRGPPKVGVKQTTKITRT
ncbi:MAG: hypothetical protein R2688_10585 [Fimbriimonadaceae bacterium]